MVDLFALCDLATPWCMHVVVTLRIAECLDAGNTEIGEIAEAVGADRDSLDRVLRELVSKGVFERQAPGRYALNDPARALMEPGVRLALDLEGIGGRMAGAWATLLAAVRTGKSAYHEAFERSFWDDLEANPRVAESFDAMIGPAGHGRPDPEVLVNTADWESVRSVVDVGGGTGALLAEILQVHPTVQGTLVDLPRTVARAVETFETAGVMDRVKLAGQSFFDALPAGCDVYVVKNVLGDWPDAEAAALLKRCAEAARPSGRVVVFNNNVDPEKEASPELLMLVLVGGKDRSLSELRELARGAGLEMTATGKQSSGRGLVEFRPV